jgi:hypothetical protein
MSDSDKSKITHLAPRLRDRSAQRRLKCNGVARDEGDERSLSFYFSRRVTDDELRYLHDVMKRAAATVRNSVMDPERSPD